MNTTIQKPTRIDWMDPLNKIIWRKAFAEKRTEVTLRDGSQFVIEYDEREEGLCWIRPADKWQFMPCGWFRYKELTKNGNWISSK